MTAIPDGDFNGDSFSDILWQTRAAAGLDLGHEREPLRGGGTPVSPNPGLRWKAIGTGDFNGDSHSDILLQNTNGQASIWEMNGNSSDRRRGGEPQPRAELESGRDGRFQRRRPFRHPFSKREQRPGLDLGNGGEHLKGGGPVSPNPGPSWHAIGTGDFNGDGLSDMLFQNTSSGQVSIWEMNGNNVKGRRGRSPPIRGRLACHRNRRLQRRRPFRHSFSKHERPGFDLGNERDQTHRRRAGYPQSRAKLARHRNRRFQWRRLFRHPVSKHERPSLDLGNEREHQIGGGPVTPNPGSSWRAVGA